MQIIAVKCGKNLNVDSYSGLIKHKKSRNYIQCKKCGFSWFSSKYENKCKNNTCATIVYNLTPELLINGKNKTCLKGTIKRIYVQSSNLIYPI